MTNIDDEMQESFSGKLAYVQRICTPYRVPYFERLSSNCLGGLRVLHGKGATSYGDIDRISFCELLNVEVPTRRGSYLLCYQRGLIDSLRKFKPDAIIAEANPRLLSNISLIKWAQRNGTPVIGHGLGTMRLSSSPNWLRYVFLRRYITCFDAIIAYSSRAKQEYMNLGMPENRITVACNSHRDPPTTKISRAFPANGTYPTISFVGQLEKQKRVDMLIKASHHARSKPRIIIIGEGQERESLQRLSNDLGVVCEFVGAKRGEELDRILGSSDLFVMPGLGGLAVHDAMAVGLPVIVGEGDGTQYDVVDPSNGWHFDDGKIDTLTQLIDDAFASPLKLLKMGDESFRRIREDVNVQNMVASVTSLVNRITDIRRNLYS